jgi:hypothetical protein
MKGLIQILLKEQAPRISTGAKPIAEPNEYTDLLSPDFSNIFNGEKGTSTTDGGTSGVGNIFNLVSNKNFVKKGWVFVDESEWNEDIKNDVLSAREDADSYTRGNIMVAAPTNNKQEQTVVLAGKTLESGDEKSEPHKYVVKQNPQGEWGWMDDDKKTTPMWRPFKSY